MVVLARINVAHVVRNRLPISQEEDNPYPAMYRPTHSDEARVSHYKPLPFDSNISVQHLCKCKDKTDIPLISLISI